MLPKLLHLSLPARRAAQRLQGESESSPPPRQGGAHDVGRPLALSPEATTPVGAGSSKALSPFIKGIPWLKQPFRKRKA